MIKELLGKKLGMTTVYQEGNAVPATVLEIGPCVVLQVKNQKTDGYDALQVGLGEKRPKSTTKAMTGHFQKAGVTPKQFIMEILIPKGTKEEFKPGQTIKFSEVFNVGDIVDVAFSLTSTGASTWEIASNLADTYFSGFLVQSL